MVSSTCIYRLFWHDRHCWAWLRRHLVCYAQPRILSDPAGRAGLTALRRERLHPWRTFFSVQAVRQCSCAETARRVALKAKSLLGVALSFDWIGCCQSCCPMPSPYFALANVPPPVPCHPAP